MSAVDLAAADPRKRLQVEAAGAEELVVKVCFLQARDLRGKLLSPDSARCRQGPGPAPAACTGSTASSCQRCSHQCLNQNDQGSHRAIFHVLHCSRMDFTPSADPSPFLRSSRS